MKSECELSGVEGQRWLQIKARAGDCFAAEKLGEKLIESNAADAKVDQGVEWLRFAIAAGSPYAMFSLGVRILDREVSNLLPKEGWQLLEAACAKGNLAAMTELGTRLIYGRTVPQDTREGERWLREAAQRGDAVALIRLSRLLDRSVYITAPIKERKLWAARAGLLGESAFRVRGLYLYSEALCSPTKPMRRLLLSEAASMMMEGHLKGDLGAAASLAFLLRRRQLDQTISVPDATGPASIDTLLEEGVLRGLPFAQINKALVFALGFECEPDWEEADRLVSTLRSTLGILEWWWSLALDGDAEGDLVLAWLCRHGLAEDPEYISVEQRFDRVDRRLCLVPDWMREGCRSASAGVSARE